MNGEDLCKIGVEGHFILGLCKQDIRGFTEDVEDSSNRFRFSGFLPLNISTESSSSLMIPSHPFSEEESVCSGTLELLGSRVDETSPDASNDPRVLE